MTNQPRIDHSDRIARTLATILAGEHGAARATRVGKELARLERAHNIAAAALAAIPAGWSDTTPLQLAAGVAAADIKARRIAWFAAASVASASRCELDNARAKAVRAVSY